MRLLLGDRALSGARPFSEAQAQAYAAVSNAPAARLLSSTEQATSPATKEFQMPNRNSLRLGTASPEVQAQIERKWASTWKPRLHARLQSGGYHMRTELWKSFSKEPWSLKVDKS